MTFNLHSPTQQSILRCTCPDDETLMDIVLANLQNIGNEGNIARFFSNTYYCFHLMAKIKRFDNFLGMQKPFGYKEMIPNQKNKYGDASLPLSICT